MDLVKFLCLPPESVGVHNNVESIEDALIQQGWTHDDDTGLTPPAKLRKRAPLRDPSSRLTGGMIVHIKSLLPPTPKDSTPQGKCRVCLRKYGVRRDTRYYCINCNVPLCNAGGCYEIYHSVKNYY